MSSVTSVMLITSSLDGEGSKPIKAIQAWLKETREHNRPEELLRRVPWELSGGDKHFEGTVWWGGFNYFWTEDFIEVVRKQDWALPEMVIVLIRGPWDDGFSVYRVESSAGQRSRNRNR